MDTSRAFAGALATWSLLGTMLVTAGCALRGGAEAPVPAPPPAPVASSPVSPRAEDSTEEITPEELASIPEPVPARENSPVGSVPPATSAAGGGESPDKGRSQPTAALSGVHGDSSAGAGWIWRVQIFASDDLALADRKAKEAAERLRVRSHIEFQSPYYKVRLGDFATEEEAQDLRERAIQAGYPGAFRTRCAPDTTRYND